MIQCYIQNYHSCRRAKALKDQYNGLLKPLPIPSCPWTDITFDFVTGLSIHNSYNTILILVDCLTKERHYISYTTDENNTSTEVITQLLLQNIWKLHGLLSSLTSDTSFQFISGVWKNLCKILGIFANLPMSFY